MTEVWGIRTRDAEATVDAGNRVRKRTGGVLGKLSGEIQTKKVEREKKKKKSHGVVGALGMCLACDFRDFLIIPDLSHAHRVFQIRGLAEENPGTMSTRPLYSWHHS